MTASIHTLSLPRARPRRPRPPGKRLFDLTVTMALLATVWPLMLILALAVRLSSPGPVFFVQTRVGLHGRPFRMIKFRSMFSDAEARAAELAAASDRDGPCVKLRADPRVTPLGRMLRRSSLYELPQLINVLKGEMSLVGPRPALPSEVAAFPSEALRRHDVPPGITGAWQVSGRADIGFEQMIALDLDYARRASVRLDAAILLRTVGVVLSGRGAY
jgi:lipopolysaccharide/colanic/teichoic acid biosynthesis glycosyltransferase